MHAAQGQAFGQQQQYSQQLSGMMPSPYQGAGLGASGFGGGFQGGSYSYGGAWGGGYGPGNSFGNSMTSMIGGMGHAMGSAMPFLGGAAGFKAGGFGGMMMGAGAGFAVGGAMKAGAGWFAEGGHEQASMERTLSQFQFNNAGSRTGRGFSRADSQQIGNMVRQMERMPEMLTSFGELNRVMDKMGQMGLMQGIRDAGEFMRKFKDTTTQLKDLAKIMGTTLEGALQAFGEARMSGFYSKGDITKNVLNRSVTASLTGMNQGQIGALQQYGAEMGHATGGSRRTGAAHMLRTANQLGMANQMGILSNDQIMEMTGKEGAEGIQDLSARMTQLGYRMGNSNVGQALTLALGEMKDGRYTGKMDQELVERVRRGELSLGELKRMARSKAGTRGAKLSFAAHKGRLRSEMAGAVGAEGMAMQLQEILGSRGWDNPDAQNLVMQRFGASEEDANLLQQLMPNLQSIGSQMGLATSNEARRVARNSSQREQGWDAIKHRIGKKLAHYTTDWAKDLGNGVRDYFQNWADGFMDDLSGTYREYVTKRVADTVRFGIAGSGSNRAALTQMSERSARMTGNIGGGRMDVGGIGGIRGVGSRLMHWASGASSAGERAADVLGGLDGGLHLERGQISEVEGSGASVLSSSYWDRSAVGLTKFGASHAMRRFQQLNTTQGGLREFDKTLSKIGKMSNMDPSQTLRAAYRQAMQRGDVQMETDPSKRAEMVWSEMRKRLPGDMLEKLEGAGLGRMNIMAGVQAAEAQAGNTFRGRIDFEGLGKGILGNLDLNNQAAIGKAIEDQDKALGKAAGEAWSTAKNAVDSGSQIGKLLIGNEQYRGLTGGGLSRTGKYDDVSGNTVRNIASKDPSTWNDDDRKVLKNMGIDPDKLASEIAKDPEAFAKLQEAARTGKIGEDDIVKRMALTDRSGLNKITGDLNRQGRDLASRLKGDQYKTAVATLGGSSEGQEVLKMLGDLGNSLTGVNADNVSSFKDSTSAIAAKISGIKDERQREMALELAGPEVRAALGIHKDVKRGLSRKGMGKGVDGVLSAGGMKLGNTDAELAFRKDIEGLLGKDGKMNSKAELEAVLGMMSGEKAAGLRFKSGTDANSKYMSEQDVANSLKTMSENNLKATQILSNLAAGKTGKDAMEGVGK